MFISGTTLKIDLWGFGVLGRHIAFAHGIADETRAPQVLLARIDASDIHAQPRHGERIEALVAADIEAVEPRHAGAEVARHRALHHAEPRAVNTRHLRRNHRRGA